MTATQSYLYRSPPDDQRAFAFIRMTVGDEMSRRPKFVMITWIGPEVGPMKRAKVSTDKAFVKQIFQVTHV